jgi:hypothetical protein
MWSAIASIFVTKSESNHSFQPGHMHLKAGDRWGALAGGGLQRKLELHVRCVRPRRRARVVPATIAEAEALRRDTWKTTP